jgi:Photosynthesis system II assembly factor YCF48/Putative zinc-finger
MPELSNLVRQRLAATESDASQVHPDADMLTAFVEHSLPVAERQKVVTHLAVCGPCREVVALSQPELPELVTQTVIKPAPVFGWRRLLTPGFGLAASVAAMAVIAVLVLQLPQRTAPSTAQNTQQAKVAPLQDRNPQPEERKQVPVQSAETQSTPAAVAGLSEPANERAQQRRERTEPAGPKAIAGLVAPPPPPPSKLAAKAPVLTAALQKKDYVNTNFFEANSGETITADGQSNNDFPAAPQPQPGVTMNGLSGRTTGKIAGFSDIPANADGKSNVRILTPAPPPQHFGCTLCKMAQATAHTLHLHVPTAVPAIRAGALGNSALGGPGMFSTTLEKGSPAEVSAAPEKAEGGNLARSDALSRGALSSSFRSDSAPTVWKVVGGKLIKSAGPSQWEDAYPSASGSFEFSFVNARGNDVWAGGSHASLIHSRDGGLTWEIVKLGDAATGTIVNIAGSALNVQVKTSDNQTWSSTDGGKSWTLRNE